MIKEVPDWIKHLEVEDVSFMKNFILVSGSLKRLAVMYDVSYPTVRLRLDRLINKILFIDDNQDTAYIIMVKALMVDKKISYEVGKKLINEYRKEKL